MKFYNLIFIAGFAAFFAGCATVGMPNESKVNDALAKKFDTPTDGSANLYIYRPSSSAHNIKIDLDVNGKHVSSLTGSEFILLKGLKSGNIGIIGTVGGNNGTGENCILETQLKANQNNYIHTEIESGWFNMECEFKLETDISKAKDDIRGSDLVKSFYRE